MKRPNEVEVFAVITAVDEMLGLGRAEEQG
jgi:hypothetical protein